ncbi:hypothetical protein DQ04_22381000, partial [Trypanosoma grayi]|uniref:hypothetical protein n=1 Tax=Trypanosoma grayi TaxID=71804 RepID=UPI0004F4963A
MTASATNEATAPLKVDFDLEVELTIHSAFLPTARLLQCDPVAHVGVLTLQKVTAVRGVSSVGAGSKAAVTTTNVVASERSVASTRRLYFTSKPVFNETLRFVVARSTLHAPVSTASHGGGRKSAADDSGEGERCVEQRIIITMEDAQGQVYGQAACPFLLHAPSTSTQPVRVMLQPRNAHDKLDPHFRADVAALTRHGVDDFGFVMVSWRASLAPH